MNLGRFANLPSMASFCHRSAGRFIIVFIYSTIFGCAGSMKKIDQPQSPNVEKYVESVSAEPISHKTEHLKENCLVNSKALKGVDWQKLTAIANSCVVRGMWADVEMIGNRLAIMETAAPWGAYYLSLVAEDKGQTEKAYWMLELALKKAPQVGILYYQKGRLLWAKNKYQEAIEAFSRAIQLKANTYESHIFLGQVYLRDQDLSLAAKHFRVVLEANPGNRVALMAMAEISIQLRDTSAAIRYLEKMLQSDAKNGLVHFRLAKILEGDSEYLKALDHYRLAKKFLSLNMKEQTEARDKIVVLRNMMASQREPAMNSESEKKKVAK